LFFFVISGKALYSFDWGQPQFDVKIGILPPLFSKKSTQITRIKQINAGKSVVCGYWVVGANTLLTIHYSLLEPLVFKNRR